MEETVVTFRNGIRTIAVYITCNTDTGELDCNVEITPEINKEDVPDLPTLLWGIFMESLTNTNNNETPTV